MKTGRTNEHNVKGNPSAEPGMAIRKRRRRTRATWEAWPTNATGQRICDSPKRNKPADDRCQVTQGLFPNGRCRLHGGGSLAGIASPRFIHGRFSKHLAPNVSKLYEERLRDPDLVTLRDSIALQDTIVARRAELSSANGVGLNAWERMQKLLVELETARAKSDGVAFGKAFEEAKVLTSSTVEAMRSWDDVEHSLDHHRKLVDSEAKRLQARSLTEVAALAFVKNLERLVLEHVTDPVALRAIGLGLQRLAHGSQAVEVIDL